MKVRFTKHAWFKSMPEEGITFEEVHSTIRKSERTIRDGEDKFKFRYRDLEVVAQKENGGWLVITCYRV
ncbi:MAG: hypothetical protein Q8R15_03165 [Candidatus Micrarchaeota archaeon]|nr:hypothetical protein [Candidatus Micrarchaeota archaeon]